LTALRIFDAYEMELARYLIDELRAIDGVRIYGPPSGHPRTSTVSFTVGDYDAGLVSRYLDSRGLMVWSGDFFASRLIERLGVADRGGLVRIGIAPYNNRDELARVIESLRDDTALAEFARKG
jgi:selenocysteine lyase/cysteine desulfurase